MFQPTSTDRSIYVQNLFTRIAGRYDLMNRVMSAGRDLAWRRRLVRRLDLPASTRVLDLGAGTGDLAREIRRTIGTPLIIAGDFTLGMLLAGRDWQGIQRGGVDALNLPFESGCFDAVVSGFLVRNVVDVDRALTEMARVLAPGGRLCILDMTRPRKNLLTPLINFYLNRIVPLLGTWITGQKDAYTYLPDSTQKFLRAEDLAAKLENAGFEEVRFEILNFGTVAIHRANLPRAH